MQTLKMQHILGSDTSEVQHKLNNSKEKPLHVWLQAQ